MISNEYETPTAVDIRLCANSILCFSGGPDDMVNDDPINGDGDPRFV